MASIYTRTGDSGRTQLVGGDKVQKCHARIECYGTVDELNATVGLASAALQSSNAKSVLTPILQRIQNELFNVGTQLATPDPARRDKMPDITEANIEGLERTIDELSAELPQLRNFILPGGSTPAAALHLTRTVCRRAERLVVSLAAETDVAPRHLTYLNRLSDACFVFARYVLWKDAISEQLWQPDSV